MISQNNQPQSHFKIGSYLDAKDKHGDWQVGFILLFSNNQIKIRFDGWPIKYDQVFSISSPKIKPFRTVIKGYTGQKKSPAVRQHWTFSIQNTQQRLIFFQQFIQNITSKKPNQITQFLRGQHYFFIDFLLCNKYQKKQEIFQVFNYFQKHIEFVVRYMQEIKTKGMKQCFGDLLESMTNIIQRDQVNRLLCQKAYYQIDFQIFDAIYSIVGAQTRLLSFFKHNSQFLSFIISPQKSYQQYITSLLTSKNFFNTLNSLLQSILFQISNGYYSISLNFLYSLTYLFSGIQRLPFSYEMKLKIGINLFKIIKNITEGLQLSELKMHQKAIEELLSFIKSILNKIWKSKVMSKRQEGNMNVNRNVNINENMIENICQQISIQNNSNDNTNNSNYQTKILKQIDFIKLHLYLKLIKTDILQKKLRGLCKIKQYYSILTFSHQPTTSNTLCTHNLSKQQFKQLIFQNQNILKIIFQQNQHSQMIKKGCQIIYFFYQAKLLTIKQIVYIWNVCLNKHQAIKKIVFQLWVDLVQCVNQDDQMQFFNTIINNAQFMNQQYQVEFLFTVLHSIKPQTIQAENLNNYIKMIYNKTLKYQKYLNNLAKEISNRNSNNQIFIKFINNCLQKIQQNNELIFHLKLISQIFNQLQDYKIYIPKNIIQILIKKMEDVVLGINERMGELQKQRQQQYYQKRKELMYKNQNQKQKIVISIFYIFNQIIVATKNNNSHNNIIGQTQCDFKFQHFQKLWTIFKSIHLSQQHTNNNNNNNIKKIFYNWVVFKKNNQQYLTHTYQINPKFSHQLRFAIFVNILTNPLLNPLSSINISQFIIFRQFLIFINLKQGILQSKLCNLSVKKLLKVRSKEILGLENLWEIFQKAESEQVILSVIIFIKDIYLKTSLYLSKEEKMERVKELMNRLKKRIQQGVEDQTQIQVQSDMKKIKDTNIMMMKNKKVQHSIVLLMKIVSDIKQIIQPNKQFQKIPKQNKLKIKVFKSNNNNQHHTNNPSNNPNNNQTYFQQLQIYQQDTFSNIKKIISSKFNIPRQQFSLINVHNRLQIPRQHYQFPFYLLKFQEYNFRIISTQNQHSKYIMKFINQNLYSIFVSLLKNQNLCQKSFFILQLLEIQNPKYLFFMLQSCIQDVQRIKENKRKLYLHIFFLKIFAIITVDKSFNQLNHQILDKLISHLEISIENNETVIYLEKLMEILYNFIRKEIQGVNGNNNKLQLEGSNQMIIKSSIIQTNIFPKFRTKTYKLITNLLKYINSLYKTPKHSNLTQFRLLSTSINLYSLSFFNNSKHLLSQLISSDQFQSFLIDIFISCQVYQIKRYFQRKLAHWLKDGFKINSLKEQNKISQFFIDKLYNMILKKYKSNSLEIYHFGRLLKNLFEVIDGQTFKYAIFEYKLDVGSGNRKQSNDNNDINKNKNQNMNNTNNSYTTFYTQIFAIISHPLIHDTSSSPNYILNIHLQILSIICKRNRQIISEQLIEFLLYQCLVFDQNKTKGLDVKCLSHQNIAIVLELIFNIIVKVKGKQQTNKINVQNNNVIVSIDPISIKIFEQFIKLHKNNFWRNRNQWNVEIQQLAKSKSGYVGLENPGCICYLNSLLQQLFMIQQFRYNILSVQTSSFQQPNQIIQSQSLNPQQNSPTMLFNLKILFLSLLFSQRSAIDPQFFTSSLKTSSNKPMVKIFQQMDIDQFSMILFDKIQNKLQRLKYPNFVRNLFGGMYSNQVISQQCIHSSEKEEQFLSISLQVKKNILEGFQSLVKGEMLEGENSYYCDKCDKKVKALKRLSLKKLPPNLIISLRRFQFDYQMDQKIKINKYCQFPLEINLENYSQQKLNEGVKKTVEQGRSQNRMEIQNQSQQKSLPNPHLPPQYFQYKLKGVVIHTGHADSGHYYSLIQGKDKNWFQFNDQKISYFDLRNLGDEAYGGKETDYMKIKNAYLLFYQKKSKVVVGGDNNNIYNNQHKDQQKSTNLLNQSYQLKQQQKMKINIQKQSARMQQTTKNQPNINIKISSKQNQPQILPSTQAALFSAQNKKIIQSIINQNKKIRLFQFLFSKQYFQFMINLRDIGFNTYNIQIKQKDMIFNEYPKFLAIYENNVNNVNINMNNSNNNVNNNNLQIQLLKQSDNMKQNLIQEQRKQQEGIINQSKIMKQKYLQFLITYGLLVNIRQKNIQMAIQFLKSIQLFIKNPNYSNPLYYYEYFIESITYQGFINEFFIDNVQQQKAKIIGNFIYEILEEYWSMILQKQYLNQKCQASSIHQQLPISQYHTQIPIILSRFFHLLLRSLIQKSTNFDSLLIIIRKLLYSKKLSNLHCSQKILKPFVQFLFQKDIINILIDNVLGLNCGIDDKKKKIQRLQEGNVRGEGNIGDAIGGEKGGELIEKNVMNNSSNAKNNKDNKHDQTNSNYYKGSGQNKIHIKSDISASQSSDDTDYLLPPGYQQQQNQRKIQPQPLQKNQKQTIQSASFTPLFGHYFSSIKFIQKSTQKQTFIILFHLFKIIKQFKNSNYLKPLSIWKSDKQNINNNNNEIQQFLIKYEDSIDRFQMKLAQIKLQTYMKLISEMKNTKQIIVLGQFLALLITDQIKLTQHILMSIQQGFKDYQSTKYRQLFLVLQKLMLIEDNLSLQRMSIIIKILSRSLQINSQYYLEVDFIHQWILRYITKSKTFYRLFQSYPELLNSMYNWTNKRKHPAIQTIKKHRLSTCQRLSQRLHNIIVSSQVTEYQKLSHYKMQSFQRIKNGKFHSQIKYPAQPQIGQIYQKQHSIEYYIENSNYWFEGKIQGNFYGNVKVCFNTGKKLERHYINQEDQRLRIKKQI